MSTPMFFVGLDVHKDTITIAVFRNRDPEPMRIDRVPNEPKRLRRYFQTPVTTAADPPWGPRYAVVSRGRIPR